MPILTLAELHPLLARRRKLGGLDLGTKTIGLAVADGLGLAASPAETLRRTKLGADLDRLATFLKSREVAGIVLGLPVNMDGSEGPRCQATRQFAADFDRRFGLPLAFWDERLSTAAVERMMIEADYSRAKRAELVDSMAAAWILQGALDALRRIVPPEVPPG